MKISVKLGVITLASSALLIISLKSVKADDAQNPEQTATYQSLQKKQYQPGSQAYDVLNKDNPETIPKINYDTSKINFSNLDHLNRAGTATAYLTKDNLGHSDGRAPQVFKPTGWYNQPKKVNGKKVFPVNRGHLIAYSCSFNLNSDGKPDPGQKGSIDNPKNLFTQTAFSNQKVMTINEQMVRNALEKNKKVIYQVTPVYEGDDLMAQGLWVQAASTDGSMHFDRYLYNVQPGLSFDYATGRSNVDPSMQVPTPVNYENYHPKTYKKFNTGYQSHKHHRAFRIKGHYHL